MLNAVIRFCATAATVGDRISVFPGCLWRLANEAHADRCVSRFEPSPRRHYD